MGSPLLRLLAAAVACALAACSHGGTSRSASNTAATQAGQSQIARVGRPAPDWSGPTPDGHNLALASMHGKPVYLNFFATWCHGCNEEAAALQQVSAEYRARGLQVVGVDVLESPSKAASFQAQHHLKYPLVVDDGTMRRQYDINALPVQVFIDRDGVVRQIFLGQMSLADMRNNVERILQ